MAYIDSAGDSQKREPHSDAIPSEAERETGLPQLESTGCVFCDRAREPASHDRKNLILLRGEHNFVILNLYPYNSGHLMVVPYEHTSDFANMKAGTANEMLGLAQRMLHVIQAEYSPQGFNLGMNLGRVAGAGVADHVHMHLVPRWAGDTNFMPVVGETKVMPELLETTYDRLKRRIEQGL